MFICIPFSLVCWFCNTEVILMHLIGRSEHEHLGGASGNRRKTIVRTHMVYLVSNFEGRSPNESTTGLPEDNEMDPLSWYGGG